MQDEATMITTTRIHERIVVNVGDITREPVDAIVNAANRSLLGGGGVDGAIHRAGGPEILAACKELRATKYPHGLPVGEAAITSGGNLPAKYVIHTVGPVYGHHDGAEARLLAACYESCLALASAYEVASIAFPAISTGIYGYPREEAARVVNSTLLAALPRHPGINEVRLVFFSADDARIFLRSRE
jgi:O-acetyl-ADP-ribose deacetylase (regulator of RNase III)